MAKTDSFHIRNLHVLSEFPLSLQLDGNSDVIYAEEEAAGTRLLIDGRTCLLQVPTMDFVPIYFIYLGTGTFLSYIIR